MTYTECFYRVPEVCTDPYSGVNIWPWESGWVHFSPFVGCSVYHKTSENLKPQNSPTQHNAAVSNKA